MNEKTNTIIIKSIFLFSGLMLIFDWTTKVVNLPQLLMNIGKWLTTITYPIIAMYVFSMGWTLVAKDLRGIGRPKVEKIMLPIIKYFTLFAGALLLPSCLMFWTRFPDYIGSTVKIAVIIIFPVTALILSFTGIVIVAHPKQGLKSTAGHNQEDTPDQKPVR